MNSRPPPQAGPLSVLLETKQTLIDSPNRQFFEQWIYKPLEKFRVNQTMLHQTEYEFDAT
jgi:hypothetical protein